MPDRALAAGTAVSLVAAVAPAAASADSLVSNLNDTGPGSLRQALAESNAGPDAETITFAASVTVSSELAVNYATTIDGPGGWSSHRAGAVEPRDLLLSVRRGRSRGRGDHPDRIAAPRSHPRGGDIGELLRNPVELDLAQRGDHRERDREPGRGNLQRRLRRSLVGSSITGNAAAGDGGGIFMMDAPGGGTADRLSLVDPDDAPRTRVTVAAAEPATASASGTVKLGKKKLPLTKPSTELVAGEGAKLKLKPKGKRATKKIANFIRRGKPAKASIAGTFDDPSGNADQESANVKLVD